MKWTEKQPLKWRKENDSGCFSISISCMCQPIWGLSLPPSDRQPSYHIANKYWRHVHTKEKLRRQYLKAIMGGLASHCGGRVGQDMRSTVSSLSSYASLISCDEIVCCWEIREAYDERKTVDRWAAIDLSAPLKTISIMGASRKKKGSVRPHDWVCFWGC